MDLHYNAFISYKHAPLDTKVAAEVQRQLERFPIPGAIRKSTGVRRIDRIFRDKEELTLTSDLNETIENALNHSDFLIVICSKATRESVWVQREIEFFLKTHDRKHILTVVAEGEPVDVVPQILQYQDMELTTQDGGVETVHVPIEPLSCDYRGSFKKARREELPRLAAALLGCSYDDLRRRQRQYRMRRNGAIITVLGLALTAVAVYYAWSAAQIQKNYEQSLRNQSEYLASESQKLLDSGDRLTAMLLAIEALPSEESDRPVVSSAINALAEAAYAYVPAGFQGSTLHSAFIHEGRVDQFFTDEAETRLYVRHSSYNVTVWDMESHSQIFSKRFDAMVRHIALTAEGNLLVVTDYAIVCLEAESWEELWRYADNTYTGKAQPQCISEQNIVFVNAMDRFLALDSLSGAVLWEAEVPEDSAGERASLAGLTFSPSYNYAASVTAYNDGYAVAVWDIVENTVAVNPVPVYYPVGDVFVNDDGAACVIGSAMPEQDTSFSYATSGIEYNFLYAGLAKIACVDLSGSLRWESELTYSEQYEGYFLEGYPHPTGDGGDWTLAVACAAGEKVRAIDFATGRVLEDITFPSAVTSIEAGMSRIRCVLHDGDLGIYMFSLGIPTTLRFFVSDIGLSQLGEDILVCPDRSERILLYQWDMYDENWVSLTENEDYYGASSQTLETKQGLLMLTTRNELHYYDAQTEQKRWEIPLEQGYYSYLLSGTDEAQQYAYILWQNEQDYHTYLMTVDLAAGEAEITPLEYDRYSENAQCGGGFLYYSNLDGMVRLELASGTAELLPAGMDIRYFMVSQDGSAFLLWNSSGEFGLMRDGQVTMARDSYQASVDLNAFANEMELLDEDTLQAMAEAYSYTAVAWSETDGKIALTDGQYIYIFDEGFEPLARISCNAMQVVSMAFFEDKLLVAYQDQGLYRYDAQSGAYLGKTEAACGDGYHNTARWDFSREGELALHLDYDLSVIDLETWQVKTYVDNCEGYCAETQKVFVYGWTNSDTGDYQLGLFSIYDYPELIRMAQDILAGQTLTDDQKAAYGLD